MALNLAQSRNSGTEPNADRSTPGHAAQSLALPGRFNCVLAEGQPTKKIEPELRPVASAKQLAGPVPPNPERADM